MEAKKEEAAAPAEAADIVESTECTCDWYRRVHEIVEEWYKQRSAEVFPPQVAVVHKRVCFAPKAASWRETKKKARMLNRLSSLAGRLEDVLLGINCDLERKLPKRFI